MRDQMEETRRFAEFLTDGVILARGGRIEYANPSSCRMLEAALPEDLVGRDLCEMVPAGRRELFKTGLERAASGFSDGPVTFDLITVLGNNVAVESRCTGYGGEDDPAVLVVWRDLQDRRRLEEQLFRSRKMDTIGRLAVGVAHEFGNLLTVIQGNVDKALERRARGDVPVEELQAIHGALRSAGALTGQLQAFGAKQASATRTVNCNSLVFSMDSILRRIIGEDVHLVPLYRKDLWNVRADPAQIEQILMNLAVNAREAMPRGGMLSLETSNRTVTAALEEGPEVEAGDYVVLEIADTGCGMSPEVRKHLYEPYFTTKEHRAGLGLSTAYGMVVQNGGRILCRSEPGRGTAFLVFLPRAQELSPADRSAQTEAAGTPDARSILVVDDEESVVGIVSTMLRDEGFEVFCAGTAEEALTVLRERTASVRLLIADVVMPVLNGIELSRRAAEISPGLKVLLLSGYAEQTIERYGSLRKGDLLLRKPFSMADLSAAVRGALQGSPP